MKIAPLLVLVLASSLSAADIQNFAQVNDHLYRGAAPSPAGMQELSTLGVKLVIDLREPGKRAGMEKMELEKLGIRYVNIPLRPASAPTQAEIGSVLALIAQNETSRIFVHCRRGKDRTGTVVACYRIQHDGWTNKQAQVEANRYGMSRAERGMRSFVVHFKSSPSMIKASN